MEGASGIDGSSPVIAAKLAPKYVSGFVRHTVYDATITVATHQSSAQPPSRGERTNDLLKPAAKTTTTESSSTSYDANDFSGSARASKWNNVKP